VIRIKLLSVGKTKESWLEEAVANYVKRLSSHVAFEFIWVKDDEQLAQKIHKEPRVILLDPQGASMSSVEFSEFLFKEIEKGNSRISMVIGGPEGLSDDLRKQFPLVSLSKMTFTHQITRLIILEQIYRAFEIARGSQYHK
jgi:23S rRNA (pseudouridine1915-N3)-methyltransferase